MDVKRICVFCGSSTGHDPIFRESAARMGRLLAEQNIGLVYGGGQIGLMGVVADAVLEQGGEVVGVIPEALATKELLHTGVTEMHVVHDMHARKALMSQLADAFVALPGGFGTYEELLEVITWAQLGLQQKSIGLLNTAGFFSPLVDFFERAITAGFIKEKHRELFVVQQTPAELLRAMSEHHPPTLTKWIDAEET